MAINTHKDRWVSGSYLGLILIVSIIVLIVLNIARNVFEIGVDGSDFSATKRSGLKIYTDYKTGVQYIGTQSGGLSVRGDKDGKPIVQEK